MSDVKAAQVVAIFGTLWMVLVGLHMFNETALGRDTASVAGVFQQSALSR
jgi:hypothetical protein